MSETQENVPLSAAMTTDDQTPETAPNGAHHEETAPENTAQEPVNETTPEGGISPHAAILAAIRTSEPKFAERADDETVQSYQKRLVKALSKIDVAVWDAMPQEAKIWNNEAVKAIKADEKLPIVPGLDEGAPKPAAAPKVTKGRGRPAKKAKAPREPKKAKAPAVRKEANPGGPSFTYQIRLLIVQHPERPPSEIREMFQKKFPKSEVKMSTVNTIYSDTHATLRAIRQVEGEKNAA